MSFTIINKQRAFIEFDGEKICEQDCEVIITLKDVITTPEIENPCNLVLDTCVDMVPKLTMWTQTTKGYKNNTETGMARIIYSDKNRGMAEITIYKARLWSNAKYLILSSNEDKNRHYGDRHFRVHSTADKKSNNIISRVKDRFQWWKR